MLPEDQNKSNQPANVPPQTAPAEPEPFVPPANLPPPEGMEPAPTEPDTPPAPRPEPPGTPSVAQHPMPNPVIPPAPPVPSSTPEPGTPRSALQQAIRDSQAPAEEDAPIKLSPLAEAYGKYEAELYMSGADFNEVEEKLAAWRQQYANGDPPSKILYGDSWIEDETEQTNPEPSDQASKSLENNDSGELKIR